MMGVLIGLAFQLAVLAVRLAIMLVVWTVRLMIMLVLAMAGWVSSRMR
jgi:hypothetical protein